MNPINEITMTIFPELANHHHIPQVMQFYPYFSDTQVKIRVIELVSGMFEDEMFDRFTEAKLRRFLTDNRENLCNLVEDTMQDEGYEPEPEEQDEEDLDRLLGEWIMDSFNQHIDIEAWIEHQDSP